MKTTLVPSRISENYHGRRRARRGRTILGRGQLTAEAPPGQNRRDGFLHRLRLRHALLLHRKRRRRSGTIGESV